MTPAPNGSSFEPSASDRITVGPARRAGLRRWHVIAAISVASLIIAVELLIFRSYLDVNKTTHSFQQATYIATDLANAQREALRLQNSVEGLAASADLDRVHLTLSLLRRQLNVSIAEATPNVSRELKDLSPHVRSLEAAVDSIPVGADTDELQASIPALSEMVSALERRVKGIYDREEVKVYGTLGSALQSGIGSQRLLIALSALVMLIGAPLVLSLRRRVRTDLAKAYDALRLEFDERRAAEVALRASEERFRSLVQNSSDVVTIVGADGRIGYQSPAASRVFGHDPTSLVGMSIRSLIHPADVEEVTRIISDWSARAGISSPVQWRMRHADGTWLHCETIASNLLEDPNVRGLVLNTRDVSERKTLETQLAHWAYHDSLTSLANRALFGDRIEHALARAQRTHETVACCFLDLDNFKRINDTLGHAAGDQLLVAVAERLRGCLRPSDTAARLGGDEFAILLEDTEEEDVVAIAQRILDALREPMEIQGKELIVGASVGIATNTDGTATVEDLLRNADVAMYTVKGSGKGRFEVFRDGLHSAVIERLELEADLQRGVRRDELFLQFQPIVGLRDGRIVGVEALVRWNHPTKGLLNPHDFIGLAENSGLILPLGRWIMNETCQIAAGWRAAHPEIPPIMVSLNVSARQMQDPGLVADVAEALDSSGLAPQDLIIEITETFLMQDGEATIEILGDLKELGVRIAIDDFGTGYSSLSYLRRFPVDMLKVDKSFIDGVGIGVDESAFMAAVYKLARTLRLETIVEGIERPEQLAHLRALGCEMGQGFLLAPPMNADEMEEMLRAGTRLMPQRAAR